MQLQHSLAKACKMVEINLLDLRYDMGISHIYRCPTQLVIESLYLLRHKLLLTVGKAEIGTLQAHLQIDSIGRNCRIDICLAGNAVDVPARKHIKLTSADLLLCQACYATNSIATHLCLRAVGVEHSHTKHTLSLDEQQHSVGSDRRVAVADKTREFRKVDTFE